jgi:hypothetical protein
MSLEPEFWGDVKKRAKHEKCKLALDVIINVRYQAEKLNTTELKDKAPMCWTKLQQFLQYLDNIKREYEK